jgi:hypothetical protein
LGYAGLFSGIANAFARTSANFITISFGFAMGVLGRDSI